VVSEVTRQALGAPPFADRRLHNSTASFLATTPCFPHIGGEPRPGTGPLSPCVNPATGRVHAVVQWSTPSEARTAVSRSRAAFPDWREKTGQQRSTLLRALADLMDQDRRCLAELECLDTGKPITEAQGDVARAIAGLRYYASLAVQAQDSVRKPSVGVTATVVREPLGVVAAIVPWNVPLVLAICKAAAALAAGNTVVVKPAEETPLTALRLGRLATLAGLPADVLNVVLGSGDEVGASLVADPDVSAVTFTGSTEVGLTVAADCARTLKRAALELGGKSPNIVFADADLSVAGPATAAAAFYGQGQICTAGSRLLVQREVYDWMLDAVISWTQGLRIGDPLNPDTDFGSLISEEQLTAVASGVRRAVDEGGRLVVGGERLTDGGLGSGCFFAPTIIASPGQDSFLDQEEIFGPVLSVSAFDTEEDAIARANNSRYGLAAGVWTRDLNLGRRVAGQLDCGVAWINTYNDFDATIPFGGVKLSGNVREWSEYGLEAFTRIKSVWERR
jgi:acyl-CoA reductase-like NAD-dependent aldehyde dehydrogenase